MRLWSIAFHYLDAKGLVALWRETLLAQAVLHGKTKGYKSHPQLNRFREQEHLLHDYLHHICDEADARGYKFDRTKIIAVRAKHAKDIPVTKGQVLYEFNHLLKKLETRDPPRHEKHAKLKNPPELCSVFRMTPDENIEPWEITSASPAQAGALSDATKRSPLSRGRQKGKIV
jgi:hypothetical protein